jgi:hypothetical protein
VQLLLRPQLRQLRRRLEPLQQAAQVAAAGPAAHERKGVEGVHQVRQLQGAHPAAGSPAHELDVRAAEPQPQAAQQVRQRGQPRVAQLRGVAGDVRQQQRERGAARAAAGVDVGQAGVGQRVGRQRLQPLAAVQHQRGRRRAAGAGWGAAPCILRSFRCVRSCCGAGAARWRVGCCC